MITKRLIKIDAKSSWAFVAFIGELFARRRLDWYDSRCLLDLSCDSVNKEYIK